MIDQDCYKAEDEIRTLFNDNMLCISPVCGGKNSRVFYCQCEDLSEYAVKYYCNDERDRQGTEWTAFHFLKHNRITNVSEPVLIDKEKRLTVFKFIQGQKVVPEKVTFREVDMAVDFIIKLNDIKFSEGCDYLNNASEACFSIQKIIKNIEDRFYAFSDIPGREKKILTNFFEKKFYPSFCDTKNWSLNKARQYQIDDSVEIKMTERILSPSDFGFHNAILSGDNDLMFIDFEYFGWDDPSKMIADFLLHPAMNLSLSLKRYFYDQVVKKLNIQNLEKRTEIVYPLFGLKWCLILLNEFLPGNYIRRQFADVSEKNREEIYSLQLDKALSMYQYTMQTYQEFSNVYKE